MRGRSVSYVNRLRGAATLRAFLHLASLCAMYGIPVAYRVFRNALLHPGHMGYRPTAGQQFA